MSLMNKQNSKYLNNRSGNEISSDICCNSEEGCKIKEDLYNRCVDESNVEVYKTFINPLSVDGYVNDLAEKMGLTTHDSK